MKSLYDKFRQAICYNEGGGQLSYIYSDVKFTADPSSQFQIPGLPVPSTLLAPSQYQLCYTGL